MDFWEVGEGVQDMQLDDVEPEDEIGDDGPTSPLLNRTQQTEVENSQKPNQRIQVVSFGGLAGMPIRTGGPTSTDNYQAEVGQC